jgi:hypothetical protein
MTFAARAGILTASAALAVGSFAGTAAAANTVVQVDVSAVLDGRTVSTVANGVVTVWTPGDGIDNDGGPNGYVTNAVEAILKTQGKTENNAINKALPDDGMFPADPGGRFPAIQLHFSNAAPVTSPQTHSLHHSTGPQSFMFPVPPATYSKMFLLMTSSEGNGNLTVTLNYAGGAAPTVLMLQLPDYGTGNALAGDRVFFNLISGMHKWTTSDTETDTPGHSIMGIEINPTPTATLTSIEVAKTSNQYVVFFGATGIATSAVTTGTGGSAGTTDAGAGGATDASVADSGAGGVGGQAGASGTTGAAGAATTGSAGSTAGGAGQPGASGTGGNTTGAAGAAGLAGMTGTGTSGAAGATTGVRSSSGGGCSLSGRPSPNGAALLLALVACGLCLRPRRRR